MKTIIVAPYIMHKNILSSYRKNDVFSDVKLITKEKIINSIFGAVDEGAIPYIMDSFSLSYLDTVRKINYSRFVGHNSNKNHKFDDLLKVKKSLVSGGYLKKEPYFAELFKNKQVFVTGYSKNDIELSHAFELLNIKPTYLSIEDNGNVPTVRMFPTVEREAFWVLNSIARLIDEGKDINNIYLYINDDLYLYYLKKFVGDFGFDINFPSTSNLLSQNITKDILSHLEESMSEDDVKTLFESYDGEIASSVQEIILSYWNIPYGYSIKKECILNVLKSTKIPYIKKNNAVNVIDENIYQENADIFILGFKQGSFPHIFKENDYLNNQEKNELYLNDTDRNNVIETDLIKELIFSPNSIYISFAQKDLKNDYYLSPLVDRFGLSKVNEPMMDVFYSKKEAEFIYSTLLDMAYLYQERGSDYLSLEKKIKLPYFQYSNQYTYANAFFLNSRFEHSYSSIYTYYKCPFSYYLERVLHIDEYEVNFNANLGLIAHAIFHDQKSESDFDVLWDRERQKYQFTDKESVLLENLKEDIREAAVTILKHEQVMDNPRFYREINIRDYKINNYATLKGTIDKLVVIDNQYLVLVDYKTGKDSFDEDALDYGYSMQLPTYALLAHSDSRFEKLPVIGLFINNLLNSSIKKEDEPGIKSYLKLNGKIIMDSDLISLVDPSLKTNGKCEFINGVGFTNTGDFRKSSALVSQEEMDNYEKIVKEKYFEADRNIRNNNFLINPTYVDSNNHACMYCSYRDICFMRKKQFKKVKEEKDETDDVL